MRFSMMLYFLFKNDTIFILQSTSENQIVAITKKYTCFLKKANNRAT